jgi:hypothetical protein
MKNQILQKFQNLEILKERAKDFFLKTIWQKYYVQWVQNV